MIDTGCTCAGEHRPGLDRAWCLDCSDWCSSFAFCVRGTLVQAEARVKELEEGIRVMVGEWDSNRQALARALLTQEQEAK